MSASPGARGNPGEGRSAAVDAPTEVAGGEFGAGGEGKHTSGAGANMGSSESAPRRLGAADGVRVEPAAFDEPSPASSSSERRRQRSSSQVSASSLRRGATPQMPAPPPSQHLPAPPPAAAQHDAAAASEESEGAESSDYRRPVRRRRPRRHRRYRSDGEEEDYDAADGFAGYEDDEDLEDEEEEEGDEEYDEDEEGESDTASYPVYDDEGHGYPGSPYSVPDFESPGFLPPSESASSSWLAKCCPAWILSGLGASSPRGAEKRYFATAYGDVVSAEELRRRYLHPSPPSCWQSLCWCCCGSDGGEDASLDGRSRSSSQMMLDGLRRPFLSTQERVLFPRLSSVQMMMPSGLTSPPPPLSGARLSSLSSQGGTTSLPSHGMGRARASSSSVSSPLRPRAAPAGRSRAPSSASTPKSPRRGGSQHSSEPTDGFVLSEDEEEESATTPPSCGIEVVRKIVMLGARNSGKSSVAMRFAQGRYESAYDPTIETTLRKRISLDGVSFQLDIVDTAGQDEHSAISRQATVGVHGYCMVFSVTSLPSFFAIQAVRHRITQVVGQFTVPTILVGTKCDDEQRREVPRNICQALAESWGCIYVECSARRDVGVQDVFVKLLFQIERESGLLDSQAARHSGSDEDEGGSAARGTAAVAGGKPPKIHSKDGEGCVLS